MKAFVVTIIIIFSICFAQSAETDSLNIKHQVIGFDKIQHAAVSCLLTLSGQYVIVNKSGLDERKALSYSVSSAALIGLTKELSDWNRKDRHFNWGDMVANGVGIAIAILIITH
ncbi:MAG: DUF2279 domain-containing protein [Planctomycetia bacterium]|nr:DUF2279 domain-containing protein [Planctomycetia bacterium]